MSKKELSSFILFNPNSSWDYTINIDENFSSMAEIFDLFGKTFYQTNPEGNPIVSGTTYFGGNLMSFIDCFESYLYNHKQTNIRINIYSKNHAISDSKIWAFITCFFLFINNQLYVNDSNWHLRIGVYISLEIYALINREFERNSWLEEKLN